MMIIHPNGEDAKGGGDSYDFRYSVALSKEWTSKKVS